MSEVPSIHNSSPTIDNIPSVRPFVAKEQILESFADILLRPSFMESVEIPNPDTLAQGRKSWLEAVRKAYENWMTLTETDQKGFDFLTGTFGSSEGSEVRLMVVGLKPAVLTNAGGKFEENWTQTHPDIDFKSIYELAPLRDKSIFPEIGFANVKYDKSDSRGYDVAYSPSSIAKVVEQYGDIIRKLGYDIALPPSELAQQIFTQGNPIGISLLLGYPLGGAIFHNLINEAINRDKQDWGTISEMYWAGARVILSDSQIALLMELSTLPVDQLGDLLPDQGAHNGDLTWNNPRFRAIWQESGWLEDLNTDRKFMYGEPLPEDLSEML